MLRRSFEIWFSTVAANGIRRSGFLSLGDLEDKMVEFIEHHDEHPARSYTWTLVVKAPVVCRKARSS